MEVTCEFCGTPVDPKGIGTYRHIAGWVEYRGKAGGANNVKLQSEATGFAHKGCIDIEEMKRGLKGPYQDSSLF